MASSLSPSSAITRLQTRMSGQGTGRIGNSAGVLGSRGTPTSMRGRFAKYGSQFGDEVGAMAALATTAQAQRANENGTMRRAMRPEFNADDYEARGRKRRGLAPRTMLPAGAGAQPVNQKPAPIPPLIAAPTAAPVAAPVAPKAPALPTMPSAIVKPPSQYLGQPRAHLSPARINLTDKSQPGFTLPKGARKLATPNAPRVGAGSRFYPVTGASA